MPRLSRRLALALALAPAAAAAPGRTAAQQPAAEWVASAPEVAWARRHAVPLRTDDPAADPADLAAFEPLLAGARVVGLGDGTHGTAEFFRLKDRLIRWLVERHGVTVVAVEAGVAEAAPVNEYVLTGRGDPREALRGLGFWTWSVEEMLPLVEWLRAYNASGRGRVELWGVDVQRPGLAADSVRAFVARADPAALPAVDSAYALARAVWTGGERARDPRQVRAWREAAAGVAARLEAGRARYLASASPGAVDLALRQARVVEQAAAARLPDGDPRDRGMAANAQWLADRLAPGARMVVWGHNVHVNRAAGWMGAFLAERLGAGYRPIAFGFGEGEYTAMGAQGGLSTHTAAPPPPGTVEHGLRAVGLPRFLLDLRPARGVAEARWLVEPRPFRHLGVRANDQPYRPNPLAENFDAVVFLDRGTATRPLPAAQPGAAPRP